MEFNQHDAKVGALLKKKNRTENKLTNRLCWANHMVHSLRILADCFDEDFKDAEIVSVMGDRFECVHPNVNAHSNRVYKEEDWPEFPTDLKEVAIEICELKEKVVQISGLLESELNCS